MQTSEPLKIDPDPSSSIKPDTCSYGSKHILFNLIKICVKKEDFLQKDFSNSRGVSDLKKYRKSEKDVFDEIDLSWQLPELAEAGIGAMTWHQLANSHKHIVASPNPP